MFAIIRTRYRLGKITAARVWQYADEGVITETQAVQICGPRPEG